jgi:lipopolysaccharide export system permease protein
MAKAKSFLLENFTRSFLTLFLPFFVVISIIYIIKISNISFKTNLDFSEFFILFLYMLPHILFATIPLSFIGAMINSFAKLSQENELIALFSLGYRPTKLIKYSAILSLLFAMLLGVVTIYIIPLANQHVSNFKKEKVYEAKLKILPKKLSQNFGNHHIFIEENNHNKFKNVTLFSQEKNGYLQILLSKSGSIEKEKNSNSYLNLDDGTLYRYKDKNFQIIDYKNLKLYNNQKFYSSKIIGHIKYWQKNKKEFFYYLLIAISPLFIFVGLIALGIFNPRYQKNRSAAFILIAALTVYIPAMIIKKSGNIYMVVAFLLLWSAISFWLFRARVAKRY